MRRGDIVLLKPSPALLDGSFGVILSTTGGALCGTGFSFSLFFIIFTNHLYFRINAFK